MIATLNGERKVTSDLLLAADGANSALRHRFVPDAAPNYAGYVAWRGTLDESDTPPHLLAFFDDAFTFSEARSGGHILAYFIPGEGTDIRPGRRRLNWVWYVRADETELAGALIDKDGKHHRASLPQGLVSSDAVSKLRSRAKREVHPKLAELVAATRDPFMQTMVDVTVIGTVFGRVMLVGDAAFVVRPHTAGAAAKAAYDAWVLSKSLASARQKRLRDLTDTGLVSHTKSDSNKAEVYALAARAESLSRILGELYSWGDSNAAMFGVKVGRPLKMIEGPPVEPEPVSSHRATSMEP